MLNPILPCHMDNILFAQVVLKMCLCIVLYSSCFNSFYEVNDKMHYTQRGLLFVMENQCIDLILCLWGVMVRARLEPLCVLLKACMCTWSPGFSVCSACENVFSPCARVHSVECIVSD
jgi:hypothetical protein